MRDWWLRCYPAGYSSVAFTARSWYKLIFKVRRPAAGSVVRGGEDMKAKFLGAVALALLVILVFAAVASASQATTQAILKDAQDGTINGNWTTAQIRAALTYVENNPTLQAYSDLKGVLSDYLASSQSPGEQSGQLAFTGSEILVILAAGAGLIGTGAFLRLRRA